MWNTMSVTHNGSESQRFVRRLACVLLVALLPGLSGCLVIEKKTLILVVPPDSKEVEMYYVFEGLSVLDSRDSTLEKASRDLEALKQKDLSFFVTGTSGSRPLLESFRFEDLRLFENPKRPRPLCAHRRVRVVDRDKFAKALNCELSQGLAQLPSDVDEIRKLLEEARKEGEKEETRKGAEDFGFGALLTVLQGLVNIACDFDDDSIKNVRTAADKEFQWVRFDAETIRVVIPATTDCAKRIANDKKAVKWLKDMRTLVTPINLEACDEGLAIVVGKKGEPIRFTYTDSRGYKAKLDKDLIRSVGSPKPVLIDDKPADADKLIERFLSDVRPKKK